MKARELMTPDPEFMVPGDSIQESARRMRDLDVGAMPIVDRRGRRLAGLLTDRDIVVRHVSEGCEGCSVEDHMSTGHLVTVGPEVDVGEVARSMREARVRRIPVVDEEGRLVGIVAQADLATELAGEAAGEVGEAVEAISRPGRPDRP